MADDAPAAEMAVPPEPAAVPGPSPLEKVISALRADITGGVIPPGTYLDPAAVGREHGIPTAEAISALVILRDEGIVWSQHNRRYAAPAGPPDPAAGARLGRLLAQLRDETGFSLEDLYQRTREDGHWGSRVWPDTIRAAEDGEWQYRGFWTAIDAALGADGSLLKIHDRYYAAPAGKQEPQSAPEPGTSSRRPGLSRVTAEIRARVGAGEWPPGTPIPGKMALAKDHGTSTAYIGLALSALGAQGVLDPPRVSYWVPDPNLQSGGRALVGVVLQWSDGTATPITVQPEPPEAK